MKKFCVIFDVACVEWVQVEVRKDGMRVLFDELRWKILKSRILSRLVSDITWLSKSWRRALKMFESWGMREILLPLCFKGYTFSMACILSQKWDEEMKIHFGNSDNKAFFEMLVSSATWILQICSDYWMLSS